MSISVITVTRNAERFLPQAVASVIAQGEWCHEHIFVDGGSTDQTLELIDEYQSSSNRVRWICEPDEGIGDAMNKGVELATGEFVAFLHADDYYPNRDVLSRVASSFAGEPNATWATGGGFIVSEAGDTIREVKVRRYSFPRLVRTNIIIHPSTFVRRSAFLAVGGFNHSLRYAMDYDLWLRLGQLSAPLSIHAPLSCFRMHQGSISTKDAEAALDEEYRIRADYLIRNCRPVWMHRLLFIMIKRPLNRLYIARCSKPE